MEGKSDYKGERAQRQDQIIVSCFGLFWRNNVKRETFPPNLVSRSIRLKTTKCKLNSTSLLARKGERVSIT